jgi:hypothetical protein
MAIQQQIAGRMKARGAKGQNDRSAGLEEVDS